LFRHGKSSIDGNTSYNEGKLSPDPTPSLQNLLYISSNIPLQLNLTSNRYCKQILSLFSQEDGGHAHLWFPVHSSCCIRHHLAQSSSHRMIEPNCGANEYMYFKPFDPAFIQVCCFLVVAHRLRCSTKIRARHTILTKNFCVRGIWDMEVLPLEMKLWEYRHDGAFVRVVVFPDDFNTSRFLDEISGH